MKIVFLGNNYNPLSILCLESLLSIPAHEVIVGIYNPSETITYKFLKVIIHKYGLLYLVRKGIYLLKSKLHMLFRKWGIPIKQYHSLEELLIDKKPPFFDYGRLISDQTIEYIRREEPDLIVVAAFSKILKRPLLEIPLKGTINIHPSLLPKYRGPNPYYWVLANKETETGVTVHYIDEGIDTGDIIFQEKILISPEENEITLQNRSNTIAVELIEEAIRLIDAGIAPRSKQNETDASYYPLPPQGKSLL